MKVLIGFSLSQCIRDILEGKVKEADVYALFTGTKFQTKADFQDVFDNYSHTYWRDNPKKAKAIFYRLLFAGKIFQARNFNCYPASIQGNRVWVESEKFPNIIRTLFDSITLVKEAVDEGKEVL